MADLRTTRRKIEKIDLKMQKLFLKRMFYSDEIKKIKDAEGLPYEDLDRENYLKRKYAKDIMHYRKEYLDFLDQVFRLSKNEMKK